MGGNIIDVRIYRSLLWIEGMLRDCWSIVFPAVWLGIRDIDGMNK